LISPRDISRNFQIGRFMEMCPDDPVINMIQNGPAERARLP